MCRETGPPASSRAIPAILVPPMSRPINMQTASNMDNISGPINLCVAHDNAFYHVLHFGGMKNRNSDPNKLPQTSSRAITPTGANVVHHVPALIAAAGEEAARHFLNFFIASIRNRHTRRSYARQVRLFFVWIDGGTSLAVGSSSAKKTAALHREWRRRPHRRHPRSGCW